MLPVSPPPLLRRFRLNDAPAVARLAGDRAVAAAMSSIPHPLDLANAEALLARYAADEVRGTGRHIDAEHRQAELSFWIGRPWWGRGLAPAAAGVALGVAFGALGLNRVEAYHMVRNAGSGRVLARLGFAREGVLRQRVWKAGRPEDVVAYALLRADHTTDGASHAGATTGS